MQDYNQTARSCTSFVLTGKASECGSIVYAKNSDRPFNEAQPLIFYPAADHEKRRGSYVLLYKDPAGGAYICMYRIKAAFLFRLRTRYQ